MDEAQRAEEEKAMVDSMRLAQKNMTVALDRIKTLERALCRAADRLKHCSELVSPSSYEYNSSKKTKDTIQEWADEARKPL